MMVAAMDARSAAVAAGGSPAARTAAPAVMAQIGLAPFAAGRFVRSHDRAAVGAGDSRPVFERQIRAAGVIGGEGLRDDREEVEEPAAAQGRPDCGVTVPFAEPIVPHVGVGYGRIADGSPIIQRIDAVGGGSLAEPFPLEHDLKSSQVQPLQHDRCGDDADGRFPEVNLQLRELGFERDEIVVDVACRWRTERRLFREPVFKLLKAPAQLDQRTPQSLAAFPFRGGPASITRLLEKSPVPLASVPEGAWQLVG